VCEECGKKSRVSQFAELERVGGAAKRPYHSIADQDAFNRTRRNRSRRIFGLIKAESEEIPARLFLTLRSSVLDLFECARGASVAAWAAVNHARRVGVGRRLPYLFLTCLSSKKKKDTRSTDVSQIKYQGTEGSVTYTAFS
jgi:hypothetical protein